MIHYLFILLPIMAIVYITDVYNMPVVRTAAKVVWTSGIGTVLSRACFGYGYTVTTVNGLFSIPRSLYGPALFTDYHGYVTFSNWYTTIIVTKAYSTSNITVSSASDGDEVPNIWRHPTPPRHVIGYPDESDHRYRIEKFVKTAFSMSRVTIYTGTLRQVDISDLICQNIISAPTI